MGANCSIKESQKAPLLLACLCNDSKFESLMAASSRYATFKLGMYMLWQLTQVPLVAAWQAAIQWSESEKSMKRAKHSDVRFHYVRECVTQKKISLESCASDENWQTGLRSHLIGSNLSSSVKALEFILRLPTQCHSDIGTETISSLSGGGVLKEIIMGTKTVDLRR